MAIIRRTKFTTPPPEAKFEELDTAVSEQQRFMERLEGFWQGCEGVTPHPRDVPVEKLLRGVQTVENDGRYGKMEEFYRNRIRSPLTGIRAFCVLCMGGPKAANKCTSVTCPLWAFRTGKNSFYGKFKNADAEAVD